MEVRFCLVPRRVNITHVIHAVMEVWAGRGFRETSIKGGLGADNKNRTTLYLTFLQR